jgi:hypothetical protein
MRRIVVAAIIALAAGCDGGPTGPTVDVPVSGRVLDYATSGGVPGAAVAFGDSTAVTDTNGSYSLVIPEVGHFQPVIDGRTVGSIRVTGPAYRGDFFVHGGICVARYGTVTDARTLRSIDGATVSLGGQRAVTNVDGWYRLDLGCPTDGLFPGLIGIGTTFMQVSHPKYLAASYSAGKGISGVVRVDAELKGR